MTAREFCYWLQGMFEINPTNTLDAEQTTKIKNHLDMVFIHDIDPSYPEGQQADLDAAHDGIAPGRPEPYHPPVMRC